MINISVTNKVKYLALFFIIAVTILLYFRVLSYGFISVWDDNLNVLDNNYIRNFTLHGIKALFSKDTHIVEPRLTLFTYAIDYKLWKLAPGNFHLVNLFLHLVNIILVFFLCYRLIPKVKACSLVTLLFALHPFRIESVAWVSGRKDLLYSLFFLLALLVYIRYVKKQKIFWFILVVIFGYLSLLSKIQALTLPVILLLLDYYLGRRINVSVCLEKVIVGFALLNLFEFVYFIPFVLFIICIAHYDFIAGFIKDKFRFIYKLYLRFPDFYFQTIFRIFFAFMPFWLCMRIIKSFIYAKEQYYLVLCFLFLFTCWFTFEYMCNQIREKNKMVSFWMKHHIWIVPLTGVFLMSVLFLVYLKPGLSIWNSEFSRQFSFFDQLMMAGYAFFSYFLYALFPVYLSSLRPYPDFTADFLPVSYYFFSALSVLMITALIFVVKKVKSLRKELIFGLLFFFVCIFLVVHIIPIEGKVIIAERYTYLAYFGMFFIVGVVYNKISEIQKRKRIMDMLAVLLVFVFFTVSWFRLPVWGDEMSLLNDQVAKTPEYPVVYLNRSTLYINRQNYKKAIEDLDKAIKINPGYYQAYYNRALAYSSLNLFDKAASDCSQALLISPDFANAYYLRAFSYNKMQKYARAIVDYNQALKIDPYMYLAYYNRGNSKKNILDYSGAIKDYNMTLKIRPDFFQAFNSRGVVEFLIKDYVNSIKDYSHAIRLDASNSSIYFNRALSYKSCGDMVRACEDLQQAAKMGNKEAEDFFNRNCR